MTLDFSMERGLTEEDKRRILAVLAQVDVEKLEGSIAVQYDRKGYPTLSNVNSTNPYRSRSGSTPFVLNVRVEVEEWESGFPEIEMIVADTLGAQAVQAETERQARMVALRNQIEANKVELALLETQ